MVEMPKQPEAKAEINSSVLREIVANMLAEKKPDEVLRQGFFWRAIFLFAQENHLKLSSETVKDLYNKAFPIITEILDQRGVRYRLKGVQSPRRTIGGEYKQKDRYRAWEEDHEDRNDFGPRPEPES